MNRKLENYKNVYNFCHNSNAECEINCRFDKSSSIIKVSCKIAYLSQNSERVLGISTQIINGDRSNWGAVTIDQLNFQTKGINNYWIEFDEDMAYICVSKGKHNLQFSFEIWNACTVTNNIFPFVGSQVILKFSTLTKDSDKLIRIIVSDDMGVRSIKGNHLMAYPSQTAQGERKMPIYYQMQKEAMVWIRFGWNIKDILYPWSITLKTSVMLVLLWLFGYLPLNSFNEPDNIYMLFITSFAGFFYYSYNILNLRTRNTPYKTRNNFHFWYLGVHALCIVVFYGAWFLYSYELVFQNDLFVQIKDHCTAILRTIPVVAMLFGCIGLLELFLYPLGFWHDFRCDHIRCNHRFVRRIYRKECRYTGRVFCSHCQKTVCRQCLYYNDLIHETKESIIKPALEFLPCLSLNDNNYILDRRQRQRYANFFGGDPYPVTLEVVEARDNTDQQVKFLEKVLRKYVPLFKKAQILDAGCGYGRHAIRLWEKGFKVTAADILFSNCEYVRNRNRKIKIIRTNLSELDDSVNYDFIYSLYTSIGYCEDMDRKVLARLSEQLNPNGILCIAIDNQKRMHKRIEIIKEELEQGAGLGVKFYFRRRYYYFTISHKIHHFKLHTMSYKVYSYSELLNIVSLYGMKCIKQYGDYCSADYNDNSERCIMIFRKAAL